MSEYRVRWFVRKDTVDVLRIDAESFAKPWNESMLREWMKRRDVIGMVCEVDGEIVGYVVYQLTKNYVEVISIAVAKAHRRQEIGKYLVQNVVKKMQQAYMPSIRVSVKESNLGAHLFWRAMGLRCTGIIKNKGVEDAYFFEWFDLSVDACASFVDAAESR